MEKPRLPCCWGTASLWRCSSQAAWSSCGSSSPTSGREAGSRESRNCESQRGKLGVGLWGSLGGQRSWEREDGAARGSGRGSPLRLIRPNLPLLIPAAPNAGIQVYLGQQRCYCSYSLEMFFCLSKPALVYVSNLRDICRRQRHSSRQEVCFVTLHTLQGAGDAARERLPSESQSFSPAAAVAMPGPFLQREDQGTRDGILLASL